MALVWLLSTGNAWRLAVQGRVSEHERWMVHSFAATLTAATFQVLLSSMSRLTRVSFAHIRRNGTWLPRRPHMLALEV